MKWGARIFYLFLLLAVISMPVYLEKKSQGEFLGVESMLAKLASLPQKLLGMVNSELNSEPLIQPNPEIKKTEVQSTTDANGNKVFSLGNEPAAETSGGTTFYRWQDENGVWQFSDEKPKGMAIRAEQTAPVMTVPAVQASEKKTSVQPQSTTQVHINPLSVESAVNVMDNAKQAAAMMEQRNKALREIVGEQ